MSNGVNNVGDLNPWHIVDGIMSAFVAILTWLGLKQISRIEALEKEKASQTMVTEAFEKVEHTLEVLSEKQDSFATGIHGRIDGLFRELLGQGRR